MKGSNTTLKQLLTLLIAGLFTFGMTACGGGQSGSGNGDQKEQSDDMNGGKKDGHDHSGDGGDHEHPSDSAGKEHPKNGNGGSEHPDNGGGSEHPDDGGGSEHPEESSKSQSMTIEQFADAAKAHIQKKAKKHDGHFMVEDQKTGEKLKLELEKVHRKRLSHLGDNRYFVCANFTSQDGTLYDVDIFMEGTKKSNLEEAGKPKVHKVEGEPRFTYHKEDGVWKRKSVDDNNKQASAS
jgi:hypothetical protein